MRISSLAKHLADAVEAAVILKQEGCLHAYDRFSECDDCFQVCPAAAIQIEPIPTLDEDLCQDCRACLAVCPTGACMYTGIDAVDALFYSVDSMDVHSYELLCEPNPNTSLSVNGMEAGIQVKGCLAGLGVASYLNLVGQGAESIVVRTDHCADCSWRVLPEYVINQVHQVQEILNQWGFEGTVTIAESAELTSGNRPVWRAESPPRNRRSLFRITSEESSQDTGPGSDGQTLFRERQRFIRSLRHLAESGIALSPDVSLAGLDFGWLAVDESCSACGTCARACPTQALIFETGKKRFNLSISPQICLGCGVCATVCEPQAITVDVEPTFGQVFGATEDQLLQEGDLIRCTRCKTLYASHIGGRFCPACEFRRKNPFGSKMPLGVRTKQSKS